MLRSLPSPHLNTQRPHHAAASQVVLARLRNADVTITAKPRCDEADDRLVESLVTHRDRAPEVPAPRRPNVVTFDNVPLPFSNCDDSSARQLPATFNATSARRAGARDLTAMSSLHSSFTLTSSHNNTFLGDVTPRLLPHWMTSSAAGLTTTSAQTALMLSAAHAHASKQDSIQAQSWEHHRVLPDIAEARGDTPQRPDMTSTGFKLAGSVLGGSAGSRVFLYRQDEADLAESETASSQRRDDQADATSAGRKEQPPQVSESRFLSREETSVLMLSAENTLVSMTRVRSDEIAVYGQNVQKLARRQARKRPERDVTVANEENQEEEEKPATQSLPTTSQRCVRVVNIEFPRRPTKPKPKPPTVVADEAPPTALQTPANSRAASKVADVTTRPGEVTCRRASCCCVSWL